MKTFDFEKNTALLYTKEITSLVSAIHEYRGKQALYEKTNLDTLEKMSKIAKIQSTVSSNRIEGISTTDKRINELLKEKAEPHNRDEKEIEGYRNVLETIHLNYGYIPLKSNYVLQLHRDLYKSVSTSFGGVYKVTDNIIEEIYSDGNNFVRFQPLNAFDTPQAIIDLCESYTKAVNTETADPLLLICVFILDFLCIHPFNDGNGRMSRLLTLMLLYQNGYMVGKYISIEMLIEKNKEGYYDNLQLSSKNWISNSNDYRPFVRYMLGIILRAYREFEDRTSYLVDKKDSAYRMQTIFDNHLGKISKSELLELIPDIGEAGLEKQLHTLLTSGYIKKVGGGRSTAYVKA